MPFPQVLKSGPFWSGVGTIGTGGTGVTIWHVWDSNHPTGDRQLLQDGYIFNPITTDIGAIAGTFGEPEDDQFSLSGKGCFQNFFPGVNVSNVSSAQEIEGSNIESTFKISGPTDKDSSSNPVGCALLQLSHQDENSFVFKSEITVKNDKVGWVLWVGSGGEHADSGKTTKWKKINNEDFVTQYRLLFLSRDDTNSQWQIKGGYDWYNGNMSYATNTKIKILDEQWISCSVKCSTPPPPVSKSYFGLWDGSKSGESGSKEVFQDFQLWFGGTEDSEKNQRMEMLGRTKDFDSNDLDNPGFKSIRRAYKSDQGWVTYSKKGDSSWNGFDATEVLKNWYTPFNKKKGKWTNKLDDDFCTKRIHERDLKKEILDQLKTVCAFKAPS